MVKKADAQNEITLRRLSVNETKRTPSGRRRLKRVRVQLLGFLVHLRRISFQSCPASCLLRLIQFPPPPLKGGITVTAEDLQCLDSGQYLNDVIIDFYLK